MVSKKLGQSPFVIGNALADRDCWARYGIWCDTAALYCSTAALYCSTAALGCDVAGFTRIFAK
jgi:hypothetical protein